MEEEGLGDFRTCDHVLPPLATHTHTICYVQDKMAFDMHLILCTWDVVTTCIPVTVFFPLGVQLCAKEEKKKEQVPGPNPNPSGTIRCVFTFYLTSSHVLKSPSPSSSIFAHYKRSKLETGTAW